MFIAPMLTYFLFGWAAYLTIPAFVREVTRLERLCAAVTLALALPAGVLLPLLQLQVKADWPVLAAAFLAALGAYISRRPRGKQVTTTLTGDRQAQIALLALLTVAWLFSSRLLYLLPQGWATCYPGAYGDLTWHVANFTHFELGQSWPPQNPLFANEKLAYPFFPFLLGGWLLRHGWSLDLAINHSTFLLIAAWLFLVWAQIRRVSGSAIPAWLTVQLFLMAGVTWYSWRALFNGSSDGRALLTAPAAQSENGFLNPLFSSLLPQHNLPYGLALGAVILWVLLNRQSNSRGAKLLAAVLSAALPLFHAHTALAIAPLILLIALHSRSERWRWYFIPALLFSIPTVFYFATTPTTQGAFRLQWGWMGAANNFAAFWLSNTGLIFPLAAIALWQKRVLLSLGLRRLAQVGLGLFIAGNLLRISHWEWDNYRLFLMSLLFCLPLICETGYRMAERSPRIGAGLFALFICFHSVPGLIDAGRILFTERMQLIIWDTASIQMAEKLKQVTPAQAILMGDESHNSPINLTGRRNYVGYGGHLWSHGISYQSRRRQISNLFSETPAALPPLPRSLRYLVITSQQTPPRRDWAKIEAIDRWQLWGRLP